MIIFCWSISDQYDMQSCNLLKMIVLRKYDFVIDMSSHGINLDFASKQGPNHSRHLVRKTWVLTYMSRVMREPAVCICGNKGKDLLGGNSRKLISAIVYITDSTIPQLP